MTGFFVKDYFTSDIKFSVAMYDDRLCIYTRKAERIPESLLPLFSVHFNVWICYISMAFLCSIVWAMLRFLNLWLKVYDVKLKEVFKWQYIHILIDTWVAWVRVPLNHFPSFGSERVLVASICLVSLIFGAIFESSLSTIHIHPLYFKDIETLQELEDSGLPIYYRHPSIGDDLFFSETSKLFRDLNKKLVYRKSKIINEIVQNGGKAGVTRQNLINLESLDLIVLKKIWIISECPKYYTLSYILPVGAPWEDSINLMLLRFLSTGLINKFQRDMKIRRDIKIIRERLFETNLHFKVFTLEDLQLAFYVLILGTAMATLSLIVEKLRLSTNGVA